MNDASYGALVGLGPKRSGRVFKTRYMPNYKGLHLHLRPRRATRRARNAHRFVDADPEMPHHRRLASGRDARPWLALLPYLRELSVNRPRHDKCSGGGAWR
jgi:hypothetical protein